ncbi:MAG TPA: hypothetical protein VNJ46_01995 [Gaiellaceae bacterium]|nr:hypothetical protein [Gaiellaceae bacterium]
MSDTGRAAAVLAAAVALLVPAGGAGRAHAAPAPAPRTEKVVALHRAMDRLWQDHVTWTRMVIVSFAAGAPDLQPAITRLLRNQADIGNAIKPYYGAAAGRALTALLKTHIRQAVPVLTAAKAGDRPALKQALDVWYANAAEIAAFLSKANPERWPRAETRRMMNRHLQLTTAEAVARLKGNWKADIAAYDRVRAEILEMSEMLADGIIAQFPERFS